MNMQRFDENSLELETIWSSSVSTGLTWNDVSVDVEPGTFVLNWAATYGQNRIPDATSSTFQRTTFALSDIVLENETCSANTKQGSFAI